MTFPQDDMVVVFNGWNILPGRPGLPRGQVVTRSRQGNRRSVTRERRANT
jgi:hypothetical protein